MKINIYAVKDTVAGNFMQPFYMVNDEVAKRSFKQTCEDQESNWSKIAKDLQLYKLGTFDDESGEIKADMQFLM